ncbi:hypothetical protein PENSPDRAFT_660401 [Peniophora sp. CONT]|nr:hypothetical protein PENSPDRAFT_660401 [Peniophora sp. CONT]
MYHTSWREEHWVRLASLPAKSIEAFNEEAYTLFSILAENPHAFPCLEKIIIFDEDSTGRIWNDDVDDYEGWMEAREPPYDSADLVLQTVRLRQERGPRPFKCIMLPKRYLEDDWVAELRDLVEVVEESQHGDHCHCHKVHDPYVDFSQT